MRELGFQKPEGQLQRCLAITNESQALLADAALSIRKCLHSKAVMPDVVSLHTEIAFAGIDMLFSIMHHAVSIKSSG